jgi:hypothetical protein
MLRRVLANSQGSPRSTLDREQGRCPYATATAIVDMLVSRGLAERTAYHSHPLTEKVLNLYRPAPCRYEPTADSVRRGGEFCQPDPRIQWRKEVS